MTRQKIMFGNFTLPFIPSATSQSSSKPRMRLCPSGYGMKPTCVPFNSTNTPMKKFSKTKSLPAKVTDQTAWTSSQQTTDRRHPTP